VSLADLHEQLEDQLDAVDGPRLAGPTADAPFSIDTLEMATWAVRKVARARRRFAEAQLLADAERDRIDAWLASEEAHLEQATSFLEGHLARFHRARLDEDPKARTIATPAGKLVARKQPDRVEVVDEAEYFEWARRDHQDLLRVTVAADKAALKKATTVGPDGQAMLGDEVVPGVEHVPGEIRFTVDTEAST
jgi:hypothetical protein